MRTTELFSESVPRARRFAMPVNLVSRDRVEAAWLALSLGPNAILDEEQEPGSTGGQARGGEGLGPFICSPPSAEEHRTSNRRTLLYAQPSRRVPANPWARPELF
jgi:hypothetical protein